MSFSENPNNYSKNYLDDTINSNTINLPEGKKYKGKGKNDGGYPDLQGKQSMLHSLSVLHYNDFFSQGPEGTSFQNKESRYFIGKSNNASGYRNPTGSKIVKSFDESVVNHAMQYKWGDFLFLNDYGKVPNNHLITLRRFPGPSNDNLLSNIENPNRDVSRLLGYIDGENNTFESIFNFSCGMNFQEFESEVQTMEKSQTGWGGLDFLGYADTSGKFANDKLKGEKETAYDPYASQTNITWGPIDVIDKIMTRKRGLKFEQDLKIKFKYAIRSYDGISTKVAFLDILGNMLSMTTNKAPFWGGATRFHGGGGYSGPLGDSKKLKSGDLDGFLSSFIGDVSNKLSNPFEGGLMEGIKSIAGNVGSALAGAGLDKLNRPEMYSMHSLLTGTPTGEWHLTVGNPFNPSMMYGNLIMDSASFGFEGPFTADDIPSYILLEVTLKHAMIRDKYSIQRMFNFGGTRFYGANIDFQNKSYYRNRSLNTGGGTTSPLNVSNNAIDSEGQESIAVSKEAYNNTVDTLKPVAHNAYLQARAAFNL